MADDMDAVSPPANRMIIAVLALLGVLISAYLTLHKFGYIGTLVCGTGSCETVQTSKWAVIMGVPVPLLGLIGYIVILGTAIAGLQATATISRPIGITLLVLATGAFLFSIYLSYLEKFVIHAWCRWCVGSATVATLIWICSLVEWKRLRRTV
jgi:uncharacterized membrane protein